MSEMRDPGGLLRPVLENPFEGSNFHVKHWFDHLVAAYPLLSFQAGTYARYQHGDNPSTYPLLRLIRSILEDDVVTAARHHLAPLVSMLDERRCRLSQGAPVHPRELWQPGEPLFLCESSSMFDSFPPDLAGYEMVDDDGGYGYVSPYEDVGRELVDHLDDIKYALTPSRRREAMRRFHWFRDRLLGRAGPGRPAKFANAVVLKAIDAELNDLLRLLGQTSLPPAAPWVEDVLSGAGAVKSELDLWRWRLALPILSRVEIAVIRDEPSNVSGGARSGTMTSRQLAIHLLAHRLRAEPPDLARRVAGIAMAERLKGRRSPFDRAA